MKNARVERLGEAVPRDLVQATPCTYSDGSVFSESVCFAFFTISSAGGREGRHADGRGRRQRFIRRRGLNKAG